jgi:hypothetical protein
MVPLASLGQQGEVRMVLGGGVHKLFSDYTDDLYGPFGAASLLYAPADRLELEFRYGLGKGRWIVTPSALAAYPDYFGPNASIGDFYPGSTTRIEQENEVRLSAFDLMLRYVLVKDIAATPFIYAGVSLLNYMPSTGDSHEALPNAADEVYSTSAFSVPIGAGVRIPITDRFGLELRGEYRFTMTEFLDDVNFNGSNDAITSFGVGFTYLFNEPQLASVSGADTPTGTRTIITRRTTTVITDKTVKSHTHSTRTDCDCTHKHVHTCCCCCCTQDPCSDKHRGGGTGTGRDTVTIRDTIKIPCPPDTCPPGYTVLVMNNDTFCIKVDTIVKCPKGYRPSPDGNDCIPDSVIRDRVCPPGMRWRVVDNVIICVDTCKPITTTGGTPWNWSKNTKECTLRYNGKLFVFWQHFYKDKNNTNWTVISQVVRTSDGKKVVVGSKRVESGHVDECCEDCFIRLIKDNGSRYSWQ